DDISGRISKTVPPVSSGSGFLRDRGDSAFLFHQSLSRSSIIFFGKSGLPGFLMSKIGTSFVRTSSNILQDLFDCQTESLKGVRWGSGSSVFVQRRVYSPFRGVPVADRRSFWLKSLFYSGADCFANGVRKTHSSVLVDLAENILDVNELESSMAKSPET